MWTEKGGCPSVAPIDVLRQCERAVVRGRGITPTNTRKRAGHRELERKNGPASGSVRKRDVASEQPSDATTDCQAESASRCNVISRGYPEKLFENSLAE